MRLSRHNVYIFRRRIPKKFQALFRTNEIRQSLNTSDFRLAKSLSRMLTAELENLFINLEIIMSKDSTPKYQDLMSLIKQKQTLLKYQIANEEMRVAIIDNSIEFKATVKALKQAHSDELGRINGIAKLYSEKPATAPENELNLGDAINEFFNPLEIDRRKDKPATVRKNRDSLNLFAEIIGKDKLLSKVGQVEAVKFSKEIINYGLKNDKKRAANTINGYISSVSKFNDWVRAIHSKANHSKIEWKILRHKKVSKSRDSRDLITDAEFRKIINYPEFISCKTEDKSVFWLIMIGAYSGMRLEEISQLNPKTDISVKNEIYWLAINEEIYDELDADEKSKSLKTNSAKRSVPVHSKLIENGFIEYFDYLKNNNAEHFLLNEIIYEGRIGKNAGRRVNRLITNALGYNKKTHHCFRHTISTKFKQQLVHEGIAAAIIGHSYGGITYSLYGKEYEPKSLTEAIELIKYS